MISKLSIFIVVVLGLYFTSIWLTTRGVTVIVNKSDESDPTWYSIADTVAGSISLVVAIVFTILAAQYGGDYTSSFALGKHSDFFKPKPRPGWSV